MINYDLIVIGSGPGGYVAAIRASQLGFKTAIIEKENLGGICLNWGCIPTKALLKSASVFNYAKHASDYGVVIDSEPKADLNEMVTKSREISANMSKGVEFLLKKNKVDKIFGTAKLLSQSSVSVTDKAGETLEYGAKHIVVATGARAKDLPNLKRDGKHIIGYREAMTLREQPKSMVVVGSGAIGSEFANFYNTIGTKVTLIEYMPTIVPNEDTDVAKQLGRSFKKAGIKVMVKSSVESVKVQDDKAIVTVATKKGIEEIEADVVLSAVGVTPNTENIGFEEIGVELERGKVVVDRYYQSNTKGIYAIGDIVGGPALAHVASAEAICCIEAIAGLNPKPINYKIIPGCTYTTPEISSVGISEIKAKELNLNYSVGKFPFTASGKATAARERDGFVKLIFDQDSDKILGAHLIGANVTEMISEIVVAIESGTTAHTLIKSIHPHPTMSEAIMEAAAAAYNEAIHI